MKALYLLLWVAVAPAAFSAEYQKPEQIPCTATPAGLLFCVDTNRPPQETVQENDATGKPAAKVITTNTAVTCTDGVCRSLNGEYYGNLPGKVSALVNHDYYLAVSGENVPVSFLRGTGPAWGGEPAGTAIAPIRKVYEIDCSDNLKQPCKTDQGLLMRNQLPKYYPYYQEAGPDVICERALCKDVDGQIVGLNPAYNGYAK